MSPPSSKTRAAARHAEEQPATRPFVSVLMAVYNGLPYVRETLDDLLNQTLEAFELIVVDDASKDGTWEVLQEYADRDDRIRVFRNETNLKLPATLNRGLALCSAPLVARADADDRYPPQRLERQVDFMNRHPEVGLLSCAVHKIDENGVRYTTTSFPTDDGQIRMRELFINSFAHPGVMFRKDLVQELGGYDPSYFAAEDSELWSRIRKRAKAANLAEPLVHYRVLKTSLMRTRTAEGEALSLSVRQRALSDYLGRRVSLEETRQLVRVFHARRSEPPSLSDLLVAQAGFREVLKAARGRESAGTVRYFKRQVAEACLAHYHFAVASGSPIFRTCLRNALWWDPRLLRSRLVISILASAVIPRPLLSRVSALRRRLKR